MRVIRLILGILAILYSGILLVMSFIGNVFDAMAGTNEIPDLVIWFVVFYFLTGLIMIVCNKWQAFGGCIAALCTSFAGVVATLFSEQYCLQQFIIFVVLACVAAAGIFVWEFKGE